MEKVQQHAEKLASSSITLPSTSITDCPLALHISFQTRYTITQ